MGKTYRAAYERKIPADQVPYVHPASVEKFSDMHEHLTRERKAATRLWANHEAQIQGVVGSTVGMYGDLQGIAGKAMLKIDSLQGLSLEGASDEG